MRNTKFEMARLWTLSSAVLTHFVPHSVFLNVHFRATDFNKHTLKEQLTSHVYRNIYPQ
jgi:hypothetical protein